MTSQVRVNIFIVAFVLYAGMVDAFTYRMAINKRSVEKPLVSERFSINSDANNESVVSTGVINHVRHKHEQTIGNVHVLTNIDIANLITIRNTSDPSAGQQTNATVMPGINR